jgi:hypothetical protein
MIKTPSPDLWSRLVYYTLSELRNAILQQNKPLWINGETLILYVSLEQGSCYTSVQVTKEFHRSIVANKSTFR